MEISSDRDFLGPALSYVYIRDPMRRLCHMMIACNISGRGQGSKKVTGSRDRLSEGYFIGRLTADFGLVGDQGLRDLLVVISELPIIDLHELARLNICSRFGDTWAWVAPGPKRQQVAMTGASGAAEDAPAVDEGAQAIPAPVQAPQPPPPTPQPRTMSQRIKRMEEEMYKLRQSVLGLRGVVESSITKQTRVST
ncbi:hypothetical protein Tco_0646946 [Tanacetum coccineum]